VLGKGAGIITYYVHPKRKKIAYANLKAAFSKEKTPHQIKKILKNTYKNYGQTMAEILRIPCMNEDYIKKYVKLDEGIFTQAKKKGKGAIFLTAHLGNWELSSQRATVSGYSIYVLATPQKMTGVNNIFNKIREKFGCKVVKKGMASREIIRALRNDQFVGILSDQDAGKRGTFVDFFNRPTSCATGAFNLAKKTGAVIIPVFIRRKKGPNHVMEFEPSIEISKGEDAEKEIKEKLKVFTDLQESYIRKCPDQWLWVHKRWKSTPIRKITILSDGKSGHVRQSEAVSQIYKKCRTDKGYNDSQTHVKVINVKFKSPARKALLGIFSKFSSHACQGCMRCLKFSLTKKSYSELMIGYSDLIISCGSSLAAVNAFLAIENNAKNVVIMKPGITSLKNFDLAIIPKHDNPPKRDNIVETIGSPNSIDSVYLSNEAGKLMNKIAFEKEKTIGLLLGGGNKNYCLDIKFAEKLVSQLEDSASRLDAQILATTSRRTPPDVEKYLEDNLGKNTKCHLLVIANKNTYPGIVDGILGLSDVLIVSGDSISMVSEAVSSGKHVLVFDLEKKRLTANKHEKLLTELANSGYVIRTSVDKITENALRLLRKKKPAKILDDSKKLYKALHRVI